MAEAIATNADKAIPRPSSTRFFKASWCMAEATAPRQPANAGPHIWSGNAGRRPLRGQHISGRVAFVDRLIRLNRGHRKLTKVAEDENRHRPH
jgi:hypothetical protein